MLHSITMQGVGPSESLEIDFAPRLNLITGDNGLGKSFLLDVAWWALTRTWAGEPIHPPYRQGKIVRSIDGLERVLPNPAPGRVAFDFDNASGKRSTQRCSFDRATQRWKHDAGRPPSAGLILYACIDGSFCVWDPARNYWKDAPSAADDPDRIDAFKFDTHTIWSGIQNREAVFCRGLLSDWVAWQKTNDPAFKQLTRVLDHLSPKGGDLVLEPGQPTRVSPTDVREMPTLALPYGDVPILETSAAVRRIAAMAYLLVWAFREHQAAQEFLGMKPEPRIIFLIDEIESHLHVRWQRSILSSLMDVTKELAPKANVQILATTHSPFVPLSIENIVEERTDASWDLDLVDQKVTLTRRPWERRGDIAGWATSNLFDLKSTRSIEGEAVISDLQALYRRAATEDAAISKREVAAMEKRLQAVLPELDPIFSRWRIFKESLAGRTTR
ncbi:MAG: ATP-binding protein [Polyangiales bacterium]